MRRAVPASPAARGARGFTLIELLLSVFILAIGIISVSALFPAGILQQQRAQDDQYGPVVAEAALGVLRNRVDASDFGTFESLLQFTVLQDSTGPARRSYVYRPTVGDWSWVRPSLYRVQSGGWSPGRAPDGAIDLFGSGLLATSYPGQTGAYVHEFGQPLGAIRGIPFDPARAGSSTQPPAFVVTWRERCWPMIPEGPAGDGIVPEYTWDCMFRRTGGRIQAAIFVYRVIGIGSTRRAWIPNTLMPVRRVVAASGANGSTLPGAQGQPMVVPAWELVGDPAFPGPFSTGLVTAAQGLLPTDVTVPDATNGAPMFYHHQWQMPGQWVVDNYAGVHRVIRGRSLGGASEPVEVRFSSGIAVPPLSESAGDYELESNNQSLRRGIRTFHFMPVIPGDGTVQVVPVYATVRDL